MSAAEGRGWQRGVISLALGLLAACLWGLTHRYQGLVGDAQLYALQAFAKLHPALKADVYLQDVSQDRFTVFPLLQSRMTALFGLQAAARILFVACSAAFLGAAWLLLRRLAGPAMAWFGVAMLLVTVGHYGSYGVFRFGEDFLTARSAAEALVVAGLACQAAQRRLAALGVMGVAMSLHPLMALPGLLVLACLWVGPRIASTAAVAGIAATGLIAALAVRAGRPDGPFAVVDGTWLEVVRERSQFLFLQLWRLPDWKGNALPFASLALTLLVVPERRLRALAAAAVIVGAAGLAVAWIAGTVGPVAILIQGQAWRWVWVPSFVSIVLLGPTLRQMWGDPHGGRACALVLATGWTCSAIDTWAGIGLAAALWLARPWLTVRIVRLLDGATLVLACVLVAWTLGNGWTLVSSPPVAAGRDPAWFTLARNLFGMQTLSLAVACGLGGWLATRGGSLIAGVACVLSGAAAAAVLSVALQMPPTTHRADAYAAWRALIPEGSNVWIEGARNAADFAWFTLERPNYLSTNQSAGVVFSRATAAEIRRRSEVLAPVEAPTWRIMSALARLSAPAKGAPDKDHPLTAATLVTICTDPQLGFVVAREALGFGALRNAVRDDYRDWYLYDCRTVRAAGGAA